MPKMNAQEQQAVQAWAQEHGFKTHECNSVVGIVCKFGDKRMLFAKRNAVCVQPMFFAWSPMYREKGKYAELVLLPYPNTSAADFIDRLGKSHAAARQGVDHLGKPYDQDEMFKCGQIDYFAEKRGGR